MKTLLIAGLFSIVLLLLPAANRKTVVSGPVKDVGEFQIVADSGIPVVRYAAKELQTFLKQSTGKDVSIAEKTSATKFNLILGDGPEARKAGLDCRSLPDEGYYIRRAGNRLYIAGNDSAEKDPVTSRWYTTYRRATLSGVYDFLERFAGIRFFFPGKYGTIVPEKGGLSLPEKISIMESPDMRIRRLYFGSSCRSYDPAVPLMDIHKALNFRLRLSEQNIYFGHGLNFLDLIERFSKTHPEYFALREDGKRHCDPSMKYPGQLCFSSGVCEEIYQDARAFFSGKSASSRGIRHWNSMVASGDFFCVMPQDGMYWCKCEKCRKIAEWKGVNPPLKAKQAVSNHIFRWTADMAERLTKEGIKGNLTQSIYPPYDQIPECKIPSNVYLQLCIDGTCSDHPANKRMCQKIIDWNRKTGAKISVWTYIIGKDREKDGIPTMAPKEIAKFLQKYRNELNGAFYEAETDYYLFNYLSYYVMAKVMWNSSLDAEKLLDDHYTVMFGKGAPYVRQIFEEMETCWVEKIINKTPLGRLYGPGPNTPKQEQLWGEIYSPERIKKWDSLFESAQKAASGEAAERVAFIRKGFLEPMKAQQNKFQAQSQK